jgi:solute carrier family 25 (mitochondrial carrier), member 14/30
MKEGIKGPYKGISASLARESSYTTIRLGLYEPYKQMLGAKEGVKVSFVIQASAGMLSGLTGSAIANPTDLVKVRMQACERNPTPSLVWHVR